MVLVFFAYFAVASIAAGVLTVALKHPVHCGLALLALIPVAYKKRKARGGAHPRSAP